MDLSQYGINTTTGTNGLQIPGLSGIQGTLTTIMVGITILSVLFIVLYIVNLVQRWRADRALIAMRKDIAAIRATIEQRGAPAPAAPAPPRVETLIRDESVAV